MNKLFEKDLIRSPGVLYLVLALSGFFTTFALGRFNVPVATDVWFLQLYEQLGFYKAGLLSYFTMTLSWLFLGWSFYRRFREAFPVLGGAIMLTVIAGVMVEFITIVLKTAPLCLIYLQPKLDAETIVLWSESIRFLYFMAEKSHNAAYLFYGLWLLPLAFCYFRQPNLKRITRVLLSVSILVAAFGYLFDFFIFYLSPGNVNIDMIGFTFWGEVVLLFWLLIKGQGQLLKGQ